MKNPLATYRSFLDISRGEPGYRPVAERLGDWSEVEAHLPGEELMRQACRCMDCGVPFCLGAGCPLQNVIPEINAFVRDDRWRDALRLLLQTNPFPEVTGRVCPALCEGSCCNGKDGRAVTIRQIERELADRAWSEGWMTPRAPLRAPQGTGRAPSVAVVGSGPAGLAAAQAMNRAGLAVTLYEAAEQAGGLLRYGIPDFKLAKDRVERRVELFRQEGVRIECGVRVGTDVSLDFLRRKHDAVLLACGARQPRDLLIPGRPLQGIHFALDYLTRQNQVLAGERSSVGPEWSARGRDVVVIGGGDTGSDCVGTALRQGAASVTQIELMPKAPADRASGNPWPEWPRIFRTSSSQLEGCERLFSIQTLSFEGDEDDHVYGLRCAQVEWKDRRPLLKPHTEFFRKADFVLLAMGFTGPSADAPRAAGLSNVWEAGDMAQGPSLVVRAAASGLHAAAQILHALLP